MPSPSARPALSPSRLLAVGALLVALVAVVAVAAGGGEDAPSLREQYGGHGGTPAVRTGAVGRVVLDGRWAVADDPSAAGDRRGFARGRFAGRRIALPHSANAGRITGRAGERSHEGSMAWYRTTFRVPKAGRYALRFESANHRATVYLDGRRAADHAGTYLPFEVRRRLDAGRDHTLVVRVDWRSPAAMKAEGWHRAWFNFGGINREVTIRPLPATEVLDPTVRTTLRGATARVELTARARSATRDGEVRLSGVLRRGDQAVDVRFPPVRVGKGQSREVRTSIEVPRAALWAPGSPRLYDLELRAGDEASWRGRIGLREVRRDGSRILVNGRPFVMRGASLHEDVPGRGDALRPRDMDALVRDLVALRANATRAQHPLSPALMERLDAAGIVVWMGVGPVDAPGAWTSRGPRLVRQARERVRTSLDQLQTHPSLLAWNLANEVAGQGHPAGQAAYIDAAARELKRRDPGRLVGLDVWGSHPPREDGPMYANVDAIGWTNYLGWYDDTFATGDELAGRIRAELADLRRTFPDKAIAVTEFGAEGNRANPRRRHGGLDFQATLLRTHIRTYAQVDWLSGMLAWNLRDFAVAPSFGGGSIVESVPSIKLVRGLNQKGLRTYGGRPKPAAEAVAREYAALAR
jgi:hypothetical protein